MRAAWKLSIQALLLVIALIACTPTGPSQVPATGTTRPTDTPEITETPIPEPTTPTATTTPPDQQPAYLDIQFSSGETGTNIEGELGSLGLERYRVHAEQGQSMTIRIKSPDDVGYSSFGLGDLKPLVQVPVAQNLTFALPSTQDYAIDVWGSPGAAYTLTIEISPLPTENDCVIQTPTTYDIIPPSMTAYSVSSSSAAVYTEAQYGVSFKVVLSTPDGWYGVDTGVSGEVGYSRLRWIKPDPGEAELHDRCDVPQVLSYDALANTTYSASGLPPVTLFDGEGQLQEAEGTGIRHFLLARFVEYGDVDGDGRLEALVVLVHHTGGTGRFTELAVVANDAGQPQFIAGTYLGDRTLVNDMSVDADGVIELYLTETFSHEHTSSCCGPQDVTVQLGLENGELIEI
jgi:hypothetical protein